MAWSVTCCSTINLCFASPRPWAEDGKSGLRAHGIVYALFCEAIFGRACELFVSGGARRRGICRTFFHKTALCSPREFLVRRLGLAGRTIRPGYAMWISP
jgi:hypothetical protein